jgi:hypothetical protein
LSKVKFKVSWVKYSLVVGADSLWPYPSIKEACSLLALPLIGKDFAFRFYFGLCSLRLVVESYDILKDFGFFLSEDFFEDYIFAW